MRVSMRLTILAWSCALLAPTEAKITYTLHLGGVDSGIASQITTAVETAVDYYNTNGQYNKHVNCYYNSGVATADANYAGTIRFGGTRNTRVAMHEILHTLGVGTHSNYWSLMTSGTWDGAAANALISGWDQGTTLRGDSVHIWPYGLNYDSEDSTTNRFRHVRIAEAVRCDMGIGPCAISSLAGSSRVITGRASGRVLDAAGTTDGANVQLYGDWGGANQRWEVVSHGGDVYSFRSEGSGARALVPQDGSLSNNANIEVQPYTGGNIQRYSVVPVSGTTGWYVIRPVNANNMCVDAGGSSNNANIQLYSCWGGENQLWAFHE